MEAIQIRPLTRADRKRLTAIIRKASASFGAGALAEAVRDTGPSTDGDTVDRTSQIGLQVFNVLLEVVETDICEWFADIIGVTAEKFDAMPFDVELQIVEQILESEGMRGFFSRLFALRKTIAEYEALYKREKTE